MPRHFLVGAALIEKEMLRGGRTLMKGQDIGVAVMVLCVWWGSASRARAWQEDHRPEVPIECEITFEILEGVYVDVGAMQGLKEGVSGWLLHDGKKLMRVRTSAVKRDSAFLMLTAPRGPGFPAVGDPVSLILDEIAPPPVDDDRPRDEEVFVPLLAPRTDEGVGVTDPANVVHGKLSLFQDFQGTSDDLLSFNRTRMRTSGSVERLGRTPWSLEWSGELSYRSGEGLSKIDDHEEMRFELYRFSLSRRYGDFSSLRFGRFIPRELPSIGYMDGIQGEKVLSESFRLGSVLGVKPFRDDLGPTFKEPTIAPYLTFHHEADEDSFYSGTGGVLVSYYEEELDRVALLLDHRARLNAFDFYSSSELDFDASSNETRDGGTRLSRLDSSLVYSDEGWSARMGVDRFERVNTEAERDLVDEIVLEEEDFFQDSYWRYWVGMSHDLTDHFVLEETVTYIDSDVDSGLRFQLGVSYRSFLVDDGRLSITAYNMAGVEQEGYGAKLTASLPMLHRRFVLTPSIGYRHIDYDASGETLDYADVTVQAHWRFTTGWSAMGAFSFSVADDVRRGLAKVGLTWSF